MKAGLHVNFLSLIGNAIWAKLEPLLSTRLDKLEKDTEARLDALQAEALKQLDEWRHDAMDMLSKALPEMAGAVSEEAVKTIFEHTRIDEAANSVSDVFTNILGRFKL